MSATSYIHDAAAIACRMAEAQGDAGRLSVCAEQLIRLGQDMQLEYGPQIAAERLGLTPAVVGLVNIAEYRRRRGLPPRDGIQP